MYCKAFALTACAVCCIACTNANKSAQIAALTGDGAKYWDEIYATDIYDRYQRPIKLGKPTGCVKFEKSGRVTHYDYLDSLRIRGSGCNSDIVFNPDNFTLESDSLLDFGGRKYLIDALSRDVMVLKFGLHTRTATVIYRASRLQNKEITSCK